MKKGGSDCSTHGHIETTRDSSQSMANAKNSSAK